MTKTAIDQLLATSATGYAVVIDGILNIKTVTDSRRGAAMNALFILGGIQVMCGNPECDCAVEFLQSSEYGPRTKIVPVSAQVSGA